jgi:hypothetical protein
MTEKKYAEGGEELLKKFNKAFEEASKRATEEYEKHKDDPPEYDRAEMESGIGGFIEPDDDGIR